MSNVESRGMTRRDFLRGAVGIGAGLAVESLLPKTVTAQAPSSPESFHDVAERYKEFDLISLDLRAESVGVAQELVDQTVEIPADQISTANAEGYHSKLLRNPENVYGTQVIGNRAFVTQPDGVQVISFDETGQPKTKTSLEVNKGNYHTFASISGGVLCSDNRQNMWWISDDYSKKFDLTSVAGYLGKQIHQIFPLDDNSVFMHNDFEIATITLDPEAQRVAFQKWRLPAQLDEQSNVALISPTQQGPLRLVRTFYNGYYNPRTYVLETIHLSKEADHFTLQVESITNQINHDQLRPAPRVKPLPEISTGDSSFFYLDAFNTVRRMYPDGSIAAYTQIVEGVSHLTYEQQIAYRDLSIKKIVSDDDGNLWCQIDNSYLAPICKVEIDHETLTIRLTPVPLEVMSSPYVNDISAAENGVVTATHVATYIPENITFLTTNVATPSLHLPTVVNNQ